MYGKVNDEMVKAWRKEVLDLNKNNQSFNVTQYFDVDGYMVMGTAKLHANDGDLLWFCLQKGEGLMYTCARQRAVSNPGLKKATDQGTDYYARKFLGNEQTEKVFLPISCPR